MENQRKLNGNCLHDEMPLLGTPKTNYNSILEDEVSLSGVHCHTYNEVKVIDNKAVRKLILAATLCLLFMIGETVGGIFAGSIAIMTDAAHMLTDFASFVISLLAIFIARRPATKSLSFGWYRAEIIGALVSVLLILVVTGVLVALAVQRVVHNHYEIDARVMLITSGVGVAVNILMGCTLHSPANSQEASTDIESGNEKNSENINVRAAFIHVLGDLIQSIGVLVAAVIIYFKPEWKIADPICTFVFSVLVSITTIRILKDIIRVLMEAAPANINYNNVKNFLLQIRGVENVHNIRVWCLTMSKVALSCHIAIGPDVRPGEVLQVASKMISSKFGIDECTIQIESYVKEMEHCDGCKEPKD